MKHLVAIGGGNGITQLLKGAAPFFDKLSAIVSVTDTGRSTGMVRKLSNIPAPGDLRSCVASLAVEPDSFYAKLLQHRFSSEDYPDLNGVAFGNLLIAALAEVTGDFAQAIDYVAKETGCVAAVIPVSLSNTDICAKLTDNQEVVGELNVRGTTNPKNPDAKKPAIAEIYLRTDRDKTANPGAVAAIKSADLIAIGPGSFYTSICADLLFEGIVEALKATTGKVAFIVNTTTQPGQTDDFSVLDHVQALLKLGLSTEDLDFVIVNEPKQLNPEQVSRLASDGVHVILPTPAEFADLDQLVPQVVRADFSETASVERALWNKLDTIRHDPAKLGAQLAELIS